MSQYQAVQQFIQQIQWLYEPEFGDFKRKVGLYLQRLQEAHPELAKGKGKTVLDDIKTIVVYDPDGDIESTRRKIIQKAHELNS